MTGVSEVGTSGDPNVDGVLWGGFRWDSTQLTYAFPANANGYDYDVQGFQAFNTAQKAAATRAFGDVASFTGLTFTLTTSTNATIRMAEADAFEFNGEMRDNATGWGTPPDPQSFDANMWGDVWYNHTTYNQPDLGTFAYRGIMHEIGHALGLKHGQDTVQGSHDTFDPLPDDVNSIEFSLMTYATYVGDTDLANFTAIDNPTSYMQLDIAALQHLYGANFGFHSGDTTYRWSPTTGEQFVDGVGQGAPTTNFIFQTVWDGGGADTYDFSNYASAVTVDLAPGAWTKTTTDQLARLGDGHLARGSVANALLFHGDQRSLIENAVGGAGGDSISGNVARNTLSGMGGADTLDGRAGLDTLVGGSGDDRYILTDVTYVPIERSSEMARFAGPGAAQLQGSTLFDIVTENAGGGFDTVLVRAAADGGHGASSYTLTANVEHGIVTGSAAFNLTGNAQDNWLDGNAAANRLAGGDGADVLDGGAGSDVLVGGSGDDVYVLEDIANAPIVERQARQASPETAYTPRLDVVQEGTDSGIDTVLVGGGTLGQAVTRYALTDNVENGTVIGLKAFTLIGNGLANTLVGNIANNTLDGLAGADTMRGGFGDDLYVVDTAGDHVVEAAGAGIDTVKASASYTLAANVEKLILTGTSGFSGNGNTLANTVTGNTGDNVLDGKSGNDVLSGLDGRDTFLFDTALTAGRLISKNVDHIRDFSVADDAIALDNAVFATLSGRNLAPDQFKDIAVGAQDANDHVLYNHRTGVLSYDADGAGGRAAIAFAILDTKPQNLTADDFLIV